MSDQRYFNNPAGVTGVADAATNKYLRVHRDSNNEWAISGVANKSLGVAWETVDAAADDLNVRLHGAGTQIMVAAGAITAGAKVYAAASGKVAATGSVLEGIAIDAASGDGSQIGVIPATEVFAGLLAFTHTVSGAEDSANSAAINTGLGVAPTAVLERVRTSAGVERTGNTVTVSSGTVTVANANLAANDVITLLCAYNPADV